MPRIFAAGLMGLRDRMLALPLEQRFSYDPTLRMLFIDFRQLAIRSERDVDRIKSEVERRVQPLGHKVHAIVNYRGCSINPGVLAGYHGMIATLEAASFLSVTCYGASARPSLEAEPPPAPALATAPEEDEPPPALLAAS